MDLRAATEDLARVDPRMLDCAQGVLIALRRCTMDSAFGEIVRAAKRHRVPPLSIAAALVALAQDSALDDDAAAAARYEWSSLLEQLRQ
jgi:AmiR/NasT family two-component response regulator